MKRSILTEKIARRGYHLSREYSVDPLEILIAREVMPTSIVAFPASQTVKELAGWFRPDHSPKGQHLYPVVDADRSVLGVITRKDIRTLLDETDSSDVALGLLARPAPVVAYTDEPLRLVVYRMSQSGFTRMPVIDRSSSGKLAGLISLEDLLRARTRTHRGASAGASSPDPASVRCF